MFQDVIRGLSFFLILFLSTACSKEEIFNEMQEESVFVRTFPSADEALWPYFRRFEEEASKRGLNIDLLSADIEGRIEDIHSDNVLGKCNYSSQFPGLVTVDKTFWEKANDWGREFVVFHELGHCELLRGHFEEAFADGTCVSLMRSGAEDCRDNYRQSTRITYLDELFDPRRAGDWFPQ